ncbi:MAG: hypothetical protein IJL94_00325, partial [Erysipelotrichaceae bacterium]|nr:hypothetical protein [Erysipelotrichaceae bacterium]
MDRIRKLFGEVDLNWKKVIIMAIVAGVYTGIVAMMPITKETSFRDIAIQFEVWILFGIFIICNSKSNIDSAAKCFVFFLISQPLVYLVQVPFSEMGWSLFTYYRTWFIWTLLTIPMGFIGYYLKMNKWWGLFILTPVMLLLGLHYGDYLNLTLFHFPYHLLSTIFCFVTLLVYPLVVFKAEKLRKAGLMISAV